MEDVEVQKPETRVAVLISGRGSNLKALIAGQGPDAHFNISLVIANRPAAGGLEIAGEVGIPNLVIDHQAFDDREAFDRAMDQKLREAGIELVCLAGFMRILTPWFIERWQDRLINIHPSLLPAFKGLNTHQRALEAGVRVHGCTVHLVRLGLDDGPILVQGIVPVLDNDTKDSLADRVLEVEHNIYPLALEMLTSGRAKMIDGRMRIEGAAAPAIAWINPVG